VHTSLAELILQEGALPPAEVVRWLAEVCDALARLAKEGVISSCEAAAVMVSRDATEVAQLTARPEEPTALSPRSQVREVGVLGYQMLKGVLPPQPLTDTAFDGIHMELAQLLARALSGTGAGDVTQLAAELRKLRLPSQIPRRNSDTVLKARPSGSFDRTGQLFGQYELIRLLGEGGMGDVYLARHVRLGREVAIKLLKPDFAALPDLVRRFFQEAAVVNEIRHPHIVQVQDFVEEPGRVYCVMELLEGLNLADLHDREGPLPLGRICFITAQVCDALHAAHQREVVHRDIKPENIFVIRGHDGNDFAKVLDFGIARRAAGGTRTQAGAVMGTPQYMAPEQAAGRPVDARADLYSLGVMLFELLSGKTIADAGGIKLPPTDGRGAEIPKDIRALVEGLLALDPVNRPGSADEVRARLLPYVRTNSSPGLMPGLPVRPRSLPPTQPSTTQVAMADAGLKRSKAPFFLAGALLAVFGIGGWVALGPHAEAARVEPPPAVVKSSPLVEVRKPSVPEEVKPPPEPVVVKPPEPEVVKPPEPEPGAQKPERQVQKAAKKITRLKEPPAIETPPAVVAKAPSFDKARVEKLRKRFRELADVPGNKLTTVDRETIQDLLDATGKAPDTVTPADVSQAEALLSAAEARSGR
jgi:serine/threonine protein kinase